MLYSGTCEYALRALTHLALFRAEAGRGNVCRVKDIAEAEGIPRHFLGKVFQRLVRAGILRSAKGPRGGFALAKPAREIMLMDIIAAIDGTAVLDRCAIGLAECSNESPCPHHHLWESIRNRVRQYMQSTSLREMAHVVEEKRAVLRRSRTSTQ